MHERGSTAAGRREPFAHHGDDRVEVGTRQISIRPCTSDEREELIFGVLTARGLCGDLLREDVERRVLSNDRIEIAAPRRAQQRRRLDEIVERHREHAALRHARNGVTRSADALEQRGNAMRRPDLADQIDMTDVDAELEPRRPDERLQRARPPTGLGNEATLFRKTPVMGGHDIVAEPLAEMTGETLRQAARVDEDQRRSVLADELGESIVVLLPHFVRHDGRERRAWNLHGEICRTTVSLVDDDAPAARVVVADQDPRDLLDRLLRRRQADALNRTGGAVYDFFQPLERQRQMSAAARADDRMNLVDDHRAYA